MGLHKDFPASPFEVVDPQIRWFPASEDLREKGYERLLPPLVVKLREEIKSWRDSGYVGASETTRSLLHYWFLTEHPIQTEDNSEKYFQYYFAQRESVESIIYLYEVAGARNPTDLLKYDSSNAIVPSMFEETWFRVLAKQATGTGKTKVASLLLAWSFFHKTYEEDSDLSRNFLIIAPNIIVLDRLRTDFEGLKMFYEDPILPPNDYEGRQWKTDFQSVKLHIQDELGTLSKSGNIFLTNIHRVYQKTEKESSINDDNLMDYFLGEKPVTNTQDNKVSVSDIVRDIDELVVINDEAHHVHDSKLAWFKSIQDIHNTMLQKGTKLSIQIDVSATPKHDNGNIFVQTVSDYPLVEAIAQNVVKTPVLPDQASRGKLKENQSVKFSEKYRDYIHLGYIEWEKAYKEHEKLGKKAVLFIMVDDTKNCDDVAEYLESTYPMLENSTFVIHTKKNGEISEAVSGKKEQELQELRRISNEIDNNDNPYKAIVSVLMLKEGWDVKNVTTIVGLRPYTSKSNILPEQTLGRGLRRMYFGEDVNEYVSVVGTDAFLEFVESIKSEGVILEKKAMGEGTDPKTPLIIEVDKENDRKDLEKLEIEIPILQARIQRDYKNLSELEPSNFEFTHPTLREFTDEEKREIIFREITKGEVAHVTKFDEDFVPDATSIVAHFSRSIMKELRLYGGQEILYEKVKIFMTHHLFNQTVDLSDLNVVRNLSEAGPNRIIINTFKSEINKLTVSDKGETEILDYLKVGKTKTFSVKQTDEYLAPQKSVFNRLVGDSHFELQFADALDACSDVQAFTKLFRQVNFRIEYVNYDGGISHYYPDFLVKMSDKEFWVVETKGLEDFDDPRKIERLATWCEDASKATGVAWDYLYVKQDDWDKLEHTPNSFREIKEHFK